MITKPMSDRDVKAYLKLVFTILRAPTAALALPMPQRRWLRCAEQLGDIEYRDERWHATERCKDYGPSVTVL